MNPFPVSFRSSSVRLCVSSSISLSLFPLWSSIGPLFTCTHVTIIFCHHCSVLFSVNQPICHSPILLYNCLPFHPQQERAFMEKYQRPNLAPPPPQQLAERTKSREKSVIKGGGRLDGGNNPPANHTSSCGPANKLSRCSRSWAGDQITASFLQNLPENRRGERGWNHFTIKACCYSFLASLVSGVFIRQPLKTHVGG